MRKLATKLDSSAPLIGAARRNRTKVSGSQSFVCEIRSSEPRVITLLITRGYKKIVRWLYG
jgi:hypothetical protein